MRPKPKVAEEVLRLVSHSVKKEEKMTALDIYVQWSYIGYDFIHGTATIQINYYPGKDYFAGTLLFKSGIGVNAITPDIPNEIYATVDDAINAYINDALYQFQSYLSNVSTDTFTLGNIIYLDPLVNDAINSVNASIATKQATLTTGSSSQYIKGNLTLGTFPTAVSTFTNDASYATTTQLTTGLATKQDALSAMSFANPSRSLNTAFQISGTKNALVSYSVDISCTMSLTSGQSGTVVLEYADDSSFTTNVKTVSMPKNTNSGSLTIGLALTQVNTASLSGVIPAAKYVRLRTVNNTGSPTFTLQNSQEVLLPA